MEKYAVIMAGGAGSRLWPLSREKKPKQFICVGGDSCMLEQTIERVLLAVPPEKCFVITNHELLEVTTAVVRDLIPQSNVIAEPSRRNTGACIAYMTLFLKKRYGDGIACFMPADGYVRNSAGYAEDLNAAYETAEDTEGLVLIGIVPSYAATGYGYIHVGDKSAQNGSIHTVERFVEKPDAQTAERFIAEGGYFWNSGIVCGKIDSIIREIERHIPTHYRLLSDAVENYGAPGFEACLIRAYGILKGISFDKGVLEKCEKITVVSGKFDWDDIGSLDALSKALSADEAGNFARGAFCGLNTNDSVIYADTGLIATVGVRGMIIVNTDDAVIVCPRDCAQDVKLLVERLKAEGYEDFV